MHVERQLKNGGWKIDGNSSFKICINSEHLSSCDFEELCVKISHRLCKQGHLEVLCEKLEFFYKYGGISAMYQRAFARSFKYDVLCKDVISNLHCLSISHRKGNLIKIYGSMSYKLCHLVYRHT